MRRIAALALAASLAGTAAGAQTAEKQRVAREYLAMLAEDSQLEEMALLSAAPLFEGIAKTQPGLWEEKADLVRGTTVRFLAARLRQGILSQDDELAELMTLEELTAVRNFYASPAGRSAMQKLPAYLQRALPGAMQAALGNMDALRDELAALGVDLP